MIVRLWSEEYGKLYCHSELVSASLDKNDYVQQEIAAFTAMTA